MTSNLCSARGDSTSRMHRSTWCGGWPHSTLWRPPLPRSLPVLVGPPFRGCGHGRDGAHRGASFHVKHAVGSTEYEALLIGGRSGVGKSTVAWEVSAQLQDCSVAHCLIEGDFLDQAYPPPEGDPTRRKRTEDNLTALWRNFAALGY